MNGYKCDRCGEFSKDFSDGQLTVRNRVPSQFDFCKTCWPVVAKEIERIARRKPVMPIPGPAL